MPTCITHSTASRPCLLHSWVCGPLVVAPGLPRGWGRRWGTALVSGGLSAEAFWLRLQADPNISFPTSEGLEF